MIQSENYQRLWKRMVSLSRFLSWSMDTLTFSFNSVSALAFDLLSIDPLKLVKSLCHSLSFISYMKIILYFLFSWKVSHRIWDLKKQDLRKFQEGIWTQKLLNMFRHMRTRGFPVGSVVKNLPVNAGDTGDVSGLGRSPAEGKDSHSNILAWEMPWTEEPGRLQSTGSQRVRHYWAHTNPCENHLFYNVIFNLEIFIVKTDSPFSSFTLNRYLSSAYIWEMLS